MTAEHGGGARRSTDPASGTSTATDVSLREHLEMRIRYEREISDLRERAYQTALNLQASEYERRLASLNHEGTRLQQAVADNVSSDTWVAFAATYKEDEERQRVRFVSVEKFQNKLLGAMGLAIVLVPAITAVVVYLLTRHAVPVGK